MEPHNFDPENPRDILIPKDKVRKVASDKVEILGEEQTSSFRNPFEGTPFQFKHMKVISGGPMLLLLPILLPLAILLMMVFALPLMLLSRILRR